MKNDDDDDDDDHNNNNNNNYVEGAREVKPPSEFLQNSNLKAF